MNKQIAALAHDVETIVMWDMDALLSDFGNVPYQVVETVKLKPREWLTIDPQYAMTTDVDKPIVLFSLPNRQFYVADGNHRLYRAVTEQIPTMKVIIVSQDQHLRYLYECTSEAYFRVIDQLRDEGIFIDDFTCEGSTR